MEGFTAKAEGAEGAISQLRCPGSWAEEKRRRKKQYKRKSLFGLFAFEKESKRLMVIKGKLRRCTAWCGVSAPGGVLQAVLGMVWARRCRGTELNPWGVSASGTEGSVDMYLQQGGQHNPHSPRS